METGSLDRLQKVLGVFDENLQIISRELSLISRVEGTKILLEGEEESAAVGENVLGSLLAIVDAGEQIEKSSLLYCIELAREGKSGEIAGVMKGVVAVTFAGKPVKCKTVGQKEYVSKIKKNTITFGVGPAGTGKTYLAVCLAVAAFKGKEVERIILTRPAVEAGEKLGFLPGDLQTKVILDEAQNATREQMKMFLTRLGDGCKMVVTGDLTQTDLPEGKTSGLKQAITLLKGIEDIAIVTFSDKDVVRHPLVGKIVKAYERDGKGKGERK